MELSKYNTAILYVMVGILFVTVGVASLEGASRYIGEAAGVLMILAGVWQLSLQTKKGKK